MRGDSAIPPRVVLAKRDDPGIIDEAGDADRPKESGIAGPRWEGLPAWWTAALPVFAHDPTPSRAPVPELATSVSFTI